MIQFIGLIINEIFFFNTLVYCSNFFFRMPTIKKKSDEIVEKENAKLSQYIGKTSTELQMDLGKPDEDFRNEKGNFELLYKTKKYGIPCERKFEVDSKSIVIGFVSNGCF